MDKNISGTHAAGTPKAGDHVLVRRIGYTHHGVAVSATEVIHFNGEPRSKHGATIRRNTLEEFALGGRVEVRTYGKRLPVTTTIKQAESKLGSSGYNLFNNNCEHFARWCVTGSKRSRQVDNGTATALAAGNTAAGVAGSAYAVSAAGLTGVSGPGIMSGLAAFGIGGATTGLVTLAALPTATALGVVHLGLRDHDDLPRTDRKARRDGRHASKAVAATSLAAIVPTVSAVGTAGLSGAGITSGLAAVGGVVGGGMLAGTVVLAAAPAAAACMVGGGTYLVARKIRRSRDARIEARGLNR